MTSLKLEGENIFSVLKSAEKILKDAGIEEAKTDSEVLLSNVLSVKRSRLVLLREKSLSDKELLQFEKYIVKRLKREPVAYITGSCGFMGLEFIVNKDVLIPRPETELLVEEVIKNAKQNAEVLDLCTGSGCIAVSLYKSGKFAKVVALDFCDKALKVARKNALINQAKIDFFKNDILINFPKTKFDIIVSNPPYVSESEYRTLAPELMFEPDTALIAGEEGLYFYKEIAHDAKKYLKKNGLIFLELNANKADEIEEIFSYEYKNIEIIKDYSGLKRILKAGI